MKKSIKLLAMLATVFAAVTLAACGASKIGSSKSATDNIKSKGQDCDRCQTRCA